MSGSQGRTIPLPSQVELIGLRNVAEAFRLLLDEADGGERHVEAEEGNPVGGDHIEDAPPGFGGLSLIHIEADFPVRTADGQDIVIGGIAGHDKLLAVRFQMKHEMAGRVTRRAWRSCR